MSYLTRIAYNSSQWRKPTGEARQYEARGTHNHKFGFGHEDWLFRSDWLIDGWRYSFIQGVNKSHERLIKRSEPFDLTLYTIRPDGQRQYVALIQNVECLKDEHAKMALDLFKERGWFQIMVDEVDAVGGDHSSLGESHMARNVLNVRFCQDNVALFPPDTFAQPSDPIRKLNRYQLFDRRRIYSSEDSEGGKRTGRRGATSPPNTNPVQRGGSAATTYTPEHSLMQEKLLKELNEEFPAARVVREEDFVDVTVETEESLILFEIKSHLDPRIVMREALGQILEYGFHPARIHDLPPKLVIVGRKPLTAEDTAYLRRLQTEYSLPLDYRVVSI